MTSDGPQPRAPRSDRTRNRARLIDAAEEVIAESGVGAPLDEIARRAETLYRHFRTRTDLIRALYDRVFEGMAQVADHAFRGETAWDTIERYVDGVIALIWQHPAAGAVIAYLRQEDPGYRVGTEWLPPFSAVVDQAKRDGRLRPDVDVTDVAYLPNLLAELVTHPEPQRGLLLARMRALLLDSIRAGDRAPLPRIPLTRSRC